MSSQQNKKQSFDEVRLVKENLIPIYFIEDSIRTNFKIIESSLNQKNDQIITLNQKFIQTNQQIQKIELNLLQKIKQSEISLNKSIKKDFQTTVTIIVNKNLENILERISQQEDKQNEKDEIIKKKLQALHKKLLFQITQQNQKYLLKQLLEIQKENDKKINKILNKNSNKEYSERKFSNSQKIQIEEIAQMHSQYSSESNPQLNETLKYLKQKIDKLENFHAILDKKFFNQFHSLKQSWKEVGTQLLDNKKNMNKKLDTLSSQFIKIKTFQEFNNMPNILEDSFKKQIINKIMELSKNIHLSIQRSQFESINQRTKKILNRYNDELIQLRQQQSKNSEYFTFYMNNSQMDNIVEEIGKIKNDIKNDEEYLKKTLKQSNRKIDSNEKMIQELGKNIGGIEVDYENLDKKAHQFNQSLSKIIKKIKTIEDLSNIGPAKMRKMHQMLDKQISYKSTQLLTNKDKNIIKNTQLQAEIEKIKDQLFYLNSQSNIQGIEGQDEIYELKNQVKKLNQKIDKMKSENDEVSLSRKPWVCLSCDKEKLNQKIKESLLKSSPSKKKLSIDVGKSGGFVTNRSQKNINIKIINSLQTEDKFQVYEKFRQKYLSDTLKLPEIYKQKIGQLQLDLV